ncbi:MAG: hypothetical protein KAU50_04685 [Candidatus Marinimicrobia bacterium]|nr:hypothetical protein [Candidatus Neomarinimicrobiota bacterium]
MEFKYYEKEYLPRSLTSHTVALQDAVTDDDFPILKPDQYPGGDVFLVSGEFFNHSGGTGGGTKNMLDAYAGIAVALSLQDDNLATVRACRIALLISQYIAETEEGYSYERLLYDGDSGVGVWELTFLMAEAYINMKDYRNIISALECLGASEVLDEASGSFIYDAYRILEGLEKPDTWSMGAIW